MNLSATAESRYIAQKEKFDWLGEDEVIYLICRKHWYFLILSMLLPIFIGLASIPVFVFSFTLDSPSLNTFGLLVAALILIFSGLWGIYRWVDWGNDYYIVTSQRVVWLEKVIFFYYSRREAPLTHVLSIDIKSSLIGRILNFGDLDVRTFTGGIPMRRIADPNLFISFIAGYQLRAQQRMRESELKKIQKDIGDLDKDRYAEFLKTLKKKAPKEKEKEKPLPLIDWREIIDTFLKVRYEKDGTITYRKHWLVLIRKTFLPGLTLMALFVFAIFTLYQYLFKEGFGISGFPVTVVIGLFILAAFLWWLYHYLDWNNDIYRLTPEQVLDIERKPLGEEQKKTAPLDSILSLEHSREGIIRLIFNYGDVVINIGQTKFIFLGVHNPDHVHQDVANYIEARRRKKLEVSAQIERERMMDWFSTYQQRVDEGEESKKDTDWDLFPG
jgi:uncharacterized membrane protein YdbT with pleckstrin-like domain